MDQTSIKVMARRWCCSQDWCFTTEAKKRRLKVVYKGRETQGCNVSYKSGPSNSEISKAKQGNTEFRSE